MLQVVNCFTSQKMTLIEVRNDEFIPGDERTLMGFELVFGDENGQSIYFVSIDWEGKNDLKSALIHLGFNIDFIEVEAKKGIILSDGEFAEQNARFTLAESYIKSCIGKSFLVLKDPDNQFITKAFTPVL